MPESQPNQSRQATATRIASDPSGYKVCEGCDSIVGGATALCPNCHSFRFDGARQRVIDQATLLGSRDQTSVTSSDLC